MSRIFPLSCALPGCQTSGNQTRLSMGLRITALVLGIIATILGVLTILNIPGLNQLTPSGAWGIFAGGILLILVAASIKCIQEKSQARIKSQPPPSPREDQVKKDGSFQRRGNITIQMKMADELHAYLFKQLIQPQNFQTQPLGNLIPAINQFLKVFNIKYNSQLLATKTAHSDHLNDPWQTIKIIDQDISQVGKKSTILDQWNDDLYATFGICSNGGDVGPSAIGNKKQTPTCFKKNKILMKPQLQFSLFDIKRIMGLLSHEDYIQALKTAYHPN